MSNFCFCRGSPVLLSNPATVVTEDSHYSTLKPVSLLKKIRAIFQFYA
jgi:hypothetical protein